MANGQFVRSYVFLAAQLMVKLYRLLMRAQVQLLSDGFLTQTVPIDGSIALPKATVAAHEAPVGIFTTNIFAQYFFAVYSTCIVVSVLH